MLTQDRALTGRTIALPESRQLDILVAMLEKRGAKVHRCPLVAILDAPDPTPVVAWIQRFIEDPFDYLIILTGEGLRRLVPLAKKNQLDKGFLRALSQTHKLTRGPKPGQALRELGLKADSLADQPTTDGVIKTLDRIDIANRRIGVQLYGDNPNTKLIDYLQTRRATIDTVAPYIYAPDSDEQKILLLIDDLAAGEIDAIAFTSQPQLQRLLKIARKHDSETRLRNGLKQTTVAAVGPLVAQALQDAGIRLDLMPETSFFMKPMVTLLAERFESKQ